MNKSIPPEILKPFLQSYENGDVWQVHCGDSWLTVWLYSNDQIKNNTDLPIYQKLREAYFRLVVKYLDLNLSDPSDIDLHFESKENFDTKYNSSWQFYYT